MKIEAIWYEVSPYAYLVVGLASVLFSSSTLGFAFSATLVATAVTVFCLRAVYRSPASEKRRKYSRPVAGQRRGRRDARA